jgi:hypothetical protein
MVLGNGTEVRMGNTYGQGESGRGEGKSGNGRMSPYRDHVGSNTGLTQHRHWVNFIHERRGSGFTGITLMPFIDMVFDKLPGNVPWGKLFIGKYNLFLWIPFTFSLVI